jgi:hypothetical protein
MVNFINQSLIDAWDKCPERVRRRWIEGEIIPPGIAARIGTGLHKGAEVNHLYKKEKGEDLPLDAVQDAARDGYVKAIEEGIYVPPEDAAGAKIEIAKSLDITVKLAKAYREKLAPQVFPDLIEEEIYMNVPGLPIPFRGTVDCYTVDGWLPDLKTSEKKWPSGKVEKSIQPTVYRELIKAKTGAYPQRISFEVFPKTGKEDHVSYPVNREPEDFTALIKKVGQILSSIQAGIFPAAPSDGWVCSPKWCGYWWTCPYIPAYKKKFK